MFVHLYGGSNASMKITRVCLAGAVGLGIALSGQVNAQTPRPSRHPVPAVTDGPTPTARPTAAPTPAVLPPSAGGDPNG